MFRENDAGFTDDIGLIHRRMQSDVVFDAEVMPHIFEFERLIRFEVTVEMDSGGTMFSALPIDIIHKD